MGRVVPHDFWYRPEVAGDLERFDLPAALAKITVEPGWNQDDLARLLVYSRPTLNKILNGVRPLRVDEAKRIIKVLGIPPHLIGVGDEEEASPTDRRQFGRVTATALVGAASTGGTSANAVRSQTAEQIRAITRRFAALEREHGGNPLTQVLTREVSILSPTVRKQGGAAAIAAFGELCGLTGYTHYDAQQHRLADHYYSVGLQAAHESGNNALAGQIRALMSMRATWLDEANEGASHCSAALDSLPRLPSVERAMLMGRQARAEALRGERERVHQLINTSRDLMAEAVPRQSLIAYWSETEAYGNAGIAYKELGDYQLSEEHLRAAIAAADRGDSRDATLYLGMLSRLLVKVKRYDEAVSTIDEILAAPVMSNRTTRQLSLFIVKTRLLNDRGLKETQYRIRARLADLGVAPGAVRHVR